MTSASDIISLTQLDFLPYIDTDGYLPSELQGKIGVYAIFALDRTLQFVGYSRDIYLSLLQHLIRQPRSCHWLKFQIISRPSRTILEDIRSAWIEENGSIPPGNAEKDTDWTVPIDTKRTMTEAEKSTYKRLAENDQIKFLKNRARDRENELQLILKSRGVAMDIRFNPKLKEQGLLDLKF
ncbi:MAG: hypothetical protein N5P05_000592 [Chroococcopsis gigantea SAG 12.99]|jgi:hypothetical protein|nr:GIY-YIG nuclease family protein [Chlorogloea purpurea SAG 13.99]MDV2998986.1 hypothetical protein [Chroococcopsis gigantea SAG 12.99]